MPLSNVLRRSIPNPFRAMSRRKSSQQPGYIRPGAAVSIVPAGIVILPVAKSNLPSNHPKDRALDSFVHLDKSDTPSCELVTQLEISSTPTSTATSPLHKKSSMSSCEDTPTSASFSPRPPSPDMQMPPSPNTPSTPAFSPQNPFFNNDRNLTSSPELMSPSTPTKVAGRTRTIGAKFGSMFKKTRTQQQTCHDFNQEYTLSIPHSNDYFAQKQGQGHSKEKVKQPKRKGAQEGGKWRQISTRSLQIPIGTFLSSTFRSKRATPPPFPASAPGVQEHSAHNVDQRSRSQSPQEQQVQHQVLPSQPKKRRGLLSKLPKLDTRPKILSAPRDDKSNVAKAPIAASATQQVDQDQQECPFEHDAEGASTRPEHDGLFPPVDLPSTFQCSSPSNLESPDLKLLQPPLPLSSDNEEGTHSSTLSLQESNPQTTQRSFENEPEPNNSMSYVNWRLNSHIYHDERWDRASVFTTDSEIHHLSDDPNFPGYPERNAYWQKHCRIRQRRWKQQLQLHQHHQGVEFQSPGAGVAPQLLKSSKAGAVTGIAEGNTISFLDDSDYNDIDDNDADDKSEAEENGDSEQEQSFGEMLKDARSRLQSPAERDIPRRFRQQRVRYTDYAAYVATMQRKAKERAERKRSIDSVSAELDLPPKISDKLIQDVRALHQRSLSQRPMKITTVPHKPTKHIKKSADLDTDTIEQQQRQLQRYENGSNVGSSEEGNDDIEVQHEEQANYATRPQWQHQLDSGILFVASTATSAEVYSSLIHDPRSKMTKALSTPRADSMDNNKTRPPSNYSNYNGLSDDSSSSSSSSSSSNGNLDSHGGSGGNTHHSPSPSLRIRKEDDHCLSQPGLYASHNHILPLQQLLELQEQEEWRVKQLQNRLRGCLQRTKLQKQSSSLSIPSTPQLLSRSSSLLSPKPSYMSLTFSASQASLYSRSTASSSTQFLQGWSRPTTPASSRASPSPTLLATEEPLPLQSNPSSTSPEIPTAALSEVPSASTDANLLQEQEQEYQPRRQHPHRHLIPQHQHNTSPKQESNHGHMLLMLVQGRTHYYKNGTRKADPQWNGDSDLCDDDDDNDNGVLGEEEGRERVLEAAGLETRQDFVNLEGESVNGPCFTSSPLSSSPSSANPSLLLERADPASADLATSAEKTALGSLRRHSAHMDASLSSSNSVPPKLSPRPTKPARISSLGSVRGTKSRASISCSVLPTLAMPSSSHLYHLVPSPTTESDVNHQVGFTE